MMNQWTGNTKSAPLEWSQASINDDIRLHQLAPYIGKLKPAIARHLLRRFTKPGELVRDCFSGSGTIPLEAVVLGRKVLAFDANPYAVTLTRAKLEAPATFEEAVARLNIRLSAALLRKANANYDAPNWVIKFFHPETLRNTITFADECLDKDDQFLLSCLLSILHHQRPGFLSYPSSHLVPYLRDKKFSRDQYPEMYIERELAPRLLAKLRRIYKYNFHVDQSKVLKIGNIAISDLHLDSEVDAIVTSPPYMNALDYVRDNRLRMWFLDRSVQNYSPEPTEKQKDSDAITDYFAKNALKYLRVGGHCILIVGETVVRKRIMSHPAERMFTKLVEHCPSLELKEVIHDEIPDIRRSRRAGSATKRELILVLKKG
jgi:hypothetical protein